METRHPPAKGHAALRRGRFVEAGRIYHVTTATAMRARPFEAWGTASAVCRVITDPSIWRDATLLGWVLMPDHWHGLIQIDGSPLSGVVRRFKTISAGVANRAANRSGPLWQRAYHDHAVRRDEDVAAVARYVIANPVRAGLVRRVGDYPFWDAVWLR